MHLVEQPTQELVRVVVLVVVKKNIGFPNGGDKLLVVIRTLRLLLRLKVLKQQLNFEKHRRGNGFGVEDCLSDGLAME